MLAQRDVWPDRIRPLRRVDYESLVAQGLLADSRVELLRGALIDRSPQGPLHAEVVRRLADRLIRELPRDVHTRVQSPLALSDESEPEPDLAIVPGGDYTKAHPREALLIIEVADSSLLKDRGVKAGLYAAAGVPEYWLLDLAGQAVDVHRTPIDGRYTVVQHVGATEVLSPASFPALRIGLTEILAS